jgi:ring-1,2-phenylacetyl-CoA epoxidase subunit PaaD
LSILPVDNSVGCGQLDARAVAEQVLDPELPVLTLADLGVLRDVHENDGHVTVTITPTYSGCPALHEMRQDLHRKLRAAGFTHVEIRTVLTPAWTTDWITEAGRRKLAEHGIAPPQRKAGPITLTLTPPTRKVPCPRCGSARTTELSRFSSTACKALRRCEDCREPFEHVKEI